MLLNRTDNDYEPTVSSTLHPMIFVLMWLNVLLTCGGNLLTIVAFLKDKSINSNPANLYILNLAIADLKVGVISLPWFNLWWHFGDWTFGENICKCWVTIDYASTTASLLAMLLIGWDRLWMVRNIQSYVRHQTRRRTIAVILTSWLLCYVHYFITVLLWEPITQEWNIDYSNDCDFPPNYSLGYTIYEVVGQFLIPVIALAYINISVFVVINKRAKKIRPKVEGISAISATQDTLVQPITRNHSSLPITSLQQGGQTRQSTEDLDTPESGNGNGHFSHADQGCANGVKYIDYAGEGVTRTTTER